MDSNISLPIQSDLSRLKMDGPTRIANPLRRALERFADPEGGTPPPDLAEAARKLGLQADLREGMTLPQLERCAILGKPVLCCVQMHGGGHWIAVVGREGKRLKLVDTLADGDVTMDRDEFGRRWQDTDEDGKRWVRTGIILSRRQS